MANNRRRLVNKVTGDGILLAKYYPSTGWYVKHSDLKERLDAMFHARDFGAGVELEEGKVSINGMLGGNEWEIQYDAQD